jgi:hypothetical protein
MRTKIVSVIGCILLFASACEEQNIAPNGKTFPADLVPFSPEELAFIPFDESNIKYERAPLYVDNFSMLFVERKSDSLVYAWDQTFFKWDTDFSLRAEFRFHYLETDNDGTFKSLAIYLPYRNAENKYSRAHFEIPIDTSLIADSYFNGLITYHPSHTFGDRTWENIFEITPFRHVEEVEEGPLGYERIFYSQSEGIVRYLLNNGRNWIIAP